MRWVVKLGSSSVTESGKRLALKDIERWASQIANLREQGHEVVLVSSGAVAAGMARLNLTERPRTISQLQAAAAVGQSDLVQAWRQSFEAFNLPVGQVLLNHSDISNRERYLNARDAIQCLLKLPAIAVINENDSVATDEIRLGDNDTLAALVANLIDADGLLLLTDQDGVFTSNPSIDEHAELIAECDAYDPRLDEVVSDSGSQVGTGGMITKLKAARIAARSGAITTIANARACDAIQRAIRGEIGTRLDATTKVISSKKQWLAGRLKVSGRIVVDSGAEQALIKNGASLLPVGVVVVEGDFGRGDNIEIFNSREVCIARGLSNFSAGELTLIKGLTSDELIVELCAPFELEAVHRDNLVLL